MLRPPPGRARPAAAPLRAAATEKQAKKPTTLVRTGLASLDDSEAFGWMAAAAAEDRGFFKAAARAFLSDGLPYNWSIQRRHFASFEPILDFVHAAEHVHDAAKAPGEGAELGGHWAELCWQGRVAEVVSDLEERQARLPIPLEPEKDPEHPWCVVRRERGYLQNNQSRMDYPRYRRAGLPTTSSPVESWVKQINQRVKGSEKFWNDDDNAETMLHLRVAWLGDNDELTRHLDTRPGHPYARPRDREAKPQAA